MPAASLSVKRGKCRHRGQQRQPTELATKHPGPHTLRRTAAGDLNKSTIGCNRRHIRTNERMHQAVDMLLSSFEWIDWLITWHIGQQTVRDLLSLHWFTGHPAAQFGILALLFIVHCLLIESIKWAVYYHLSLCRAATSKPQKETSQQQSDFQVFLLHWHPASWFGTLKFFIVYSFR